MKLFPFQIEGVKQLREFNGRALLADSMGLGKTIQALTFLKEQPDALPAVVVCPASVKFVWEQEAEKINLSNNVLGGRTPTGIAWRSLTIINYDVLADWINKLKQLKPKTIIIDECHFTKNRATKRTKSVKKLCKGVPYVLALSGTPITNRPSEFWPTLNLLRPELFPAFWPFGQRYCAPKFNPFSPGLDYSGSSNLKELNERLTKHLMIRRRKEDVLKDLPPKLRSTVPCKMKYPTEYRKAVSDFKQWLLENYGPRKKPMALTKIGYLLRLAAKQKSEAVVQWIDDFLESTDGKLVVFAKHHGMIDLIRRKVRYKSVGIDGRVSMHNRKQAVDEFQNGKVRLFVGNIQAAGVGITLTAASTVAFAELDWVPGNMIQAADRCHRIGQRDTVNVHYLIAKGTVEEKVCEVLQKKQEVLDKAIDGVRTVDNFDMFSEILGELK